MLQLWLVVSRWLWHSKIWWWMKAFLLQYLKCYQGHKWRTETGASNRVRSALSEMSPLCKVKSPAREVLACITSSSYVQTQIYLANVECFRTYLMMHGRSWNVWLAPPRLKPEVLLWFDPQRPDSEPLGGGYQYPGLQLATDDHTSECQVERPSWSKWDNKRWQVISDVSAQKGVQICKHGWYALRMSANFIWYKPQLKNTCDWVHRMDQWTFHCCAVFAQVLAIR